MADDFDIQGLRELDNALGDLGQVVGIKVLRSAGRTAMKPVLTSAQQGINKDTGDAHDALAISARVGKDKSSVTISVGATKKKATKKQGGKTFVNVNQKVIAQEFGTRKQVAEPFLGPALENNVVLVLITFKTELETRIEKAFKKAGK